MSLVVANSGTSSGSTSTSLHFTNCVIPLGMEITVVVPPPQTTTSSTTTTNKVFIMMFNTTMERGSFQIVPGAAAPPATLTITLQHVHLDVRHSDLRATGDILVIMMDGVPTSPDQQREMVDITMHVEHSVITSTEKNAFSVMTPSGYGLDTATRINLLVGANSTLRAKYLLASVQTSRLINSSLQVDGSASHDNGITGETYKQYVRTSDNVDTSTAIEMVAGGAAVNGQAAVLSILPTASPQGAILHLENVQISVTNNNDTGHHLSGHHVREKNQLLHLVAKANQGGAAIASIVVKHSDTAVLSMSGGVAIKIAVQGGGVSAVVQQRHNITASVKQDGAAVAVGGVAIIAHGATKEANTALSLQNCEMRLSFEVGGMDEDPTLLAETSTTTALLAQAQADGRVVASTVMGIAITSYSPTLNTASTSTVSITGNSTLHISYFAASQHGSTNTTDLSSSAVLNSREVEETDLEGILLESTTVGATSSSSVLGVAVNSFCPENSQKRSTVTFLVTQSSDVFLQFSEMLGAIKPPHQISTFRSQNTAGGAVASAVLGVSIISYSPGSAPEVSGSFVHFMLYDEATFTISFSMNNAKHTTLSSPTTGAAIASTVGGLAVNTYSHSTSRIDCWIQNQSLLSLAFSTKANCNHLRVDASSAQEYVAQAVFGVALNSKSYSNRISNSRVDALVFNGSSIQVSVAGEGISNTTARSTSEKSFVASSVFGLAMNAHSHSTSEGGYGIATLSVLGGSCFTVVSTLSPPLSRPSPTSLVRGISDMALKASSLGGFTASTVLGIAVNTVSRAISTSTIDVVKSSLYFEYRVADKVAMEAALLGATSSGVHTVASSVGGVSLNTNSNNGSAMFRLQDASNFTVAFSSPFSELTNSPRGGSRINFTSTGASKHLASAVLGVALNSFTWKDLHSGGNALFHVLNGSRVAIASRMSAQDAITFAAPSTNVHVGCAVLGIALNNAVTAGAPSTQFIITDKSTLDIASRSTKGRCLTMTTTSTASAVATAILGVALNSLSPAASATTSFIVQCDATVHFGWALTSLDALSISSSGSGKDTVAASVLGVALNGNFANEGSTELVVEEKSHFTIAVIVSTNTDTDLGTSITASTAGTQSASTVMGIAMQSYSSYGNQDGPISTTFSIARSSNVLLSSFVRGSNHLLLTSSSGNSFVSAAVLGVSLNSYAVGSATGTTMFSVTNTSRFAIAASVADNVLLRSSSTEGVAASSVLGVALRTRLGSSMMVLDDDDGGIADENGVSIEVFFSNATSATCTFGGSYATIAVGGVALHQNLGPTNTHRGGIIILRGNTGSDGTNGDVAQQVESEKASLRRLLGLWGGMANKCVLTVAPKNSARVAAAAILGLVSTNSASLWRNNTSIEFCEDGTNQMSVPSSGVAVGIKPVPVGDSAPLIEREVSWLLNSSTSSINNTSCSTRATTLQESTRNQSQFILAAVEDAEQRVPPCLHTDQRIQSSTSTTATLSASSTSDTATVELQATDSFSSSVPLTSSLTVVAPPEPTNATTPPPTSPPPRKRTVTTSVLLSNNEVAATVVLSTAGASGAVATTLGSGGGGGMVVTAGSSVRMMECGLADDNPRPASFQMPIQFAVGQGHMRYFAGAALAHTLLQCFLLALPVSLRRLSGRQLRRSRAEQTVSGRRKETTIRRIMKVLSLVFCGAHAFFTPAILGACSTVLNNDDDSLSLGVAAGCMMVIVGIQVVVASAVHLGPKNGLVARRITGGGDGGNRMKLEFGIKSGRSTTTSSSSSTGSSSSDDDVSDSTSSNTTTEGSSSMTNDGDTVSSSNRSSSALLFSGSATKDILLTLFDGCRNYEKATHRHYASIETTLYSIISFISGARPRENCIAAAFTMGTLAVLQLLYITTIRPLRTRLDMIFSTLNALVLVALSLAVAISLQQRKSEEDEPPSQLVLTTVEVCLWFISSLGYLQLVVQGYWAYHVEQRRQNRLQEDVDAAETNSGSDDSSSETGSSDEPHELLVQPLLTIEAEEQEMVDANRGRCHNATSNFNAMSNPLC